MSNLDDQIFSEHGHTHLNTALLVIKLELELKNQLLRSLRTNPESAQGFQVYQFA